jgi:hypothetical protein
MWGTGNIPSRILNLGTSWRWMVSFTPQSPYSREMNPRCPLDKGLGGSRIGLDAAKKKISLASAWN